MSLQKTTYRTASKAHKCSGCLGRINVGERYAEHVAAPGGELDLEGWWRLRECAECCARYDRPVPS